MYARIVLYRCTYCEKREPHDTKHLNRPASLDETAGVLGPHQPLRRRRLQPSGVGEAAGGQTGIAELPKLPKNDRKG